MLRASRGGPYSPIWPTMGDVAHSSLDGKLGAMLGRPVSDSPPELLEEYQRERNSMIDHRQLVLDAIAAGIGR